MRLNLYILDGNYEWSCAVAAEPQSEKPGISRWMQDGE
jgi:hypothetical protein